MSPQQLQSVFEAFTQADASTTRKYGGSGLGLTISRRLTRLMGGELTATSELGRGSCFTFDVQLRLQPQVTEPHFSDMSVRGKRVLVVDDNAAARGLLAGMLSALGAHARQARSCFDADLALDDAQRRGAPFDVIIMDARMPEVDGVACACGIAARVKPQPPLVIMSTEHHVAELEQRLRKEGLEVAGVLLKPVTPSRLHDVLQVTLGRRFPAAAPVRQASKAESETTLRTTAKGRNTSKRVLLVEDNHINRELVVAIAAPLELDITEAKDGAEALAALAQAHFDLVLMDCQMPVMDGFAATEHIRRDPRWQNLPIIAMTARAMTGDRERVLAAGMNDYVSKPLDIDAFLEKLSTWLRLAPAAPLKERA